MYGKLKKSIIKMLDEWKNLKMNLVKVKSLIITAEMVKNQMRRIKNLKSLGNDRLYGLGLRYWISLYPIIAKQFNEILHKGDICDWLLMGKTYLIQKDPMKRITPENDMPIYLPTLFKLFIGIIVDSRRK